MAMGICLVILLIYIFLNSTEEKTIQRLISRLVKKCKNTPLAMQKTAHFKQNSKKFGVLSKNKIFYKRLKRGDFSGEFIKVIKSKNSVYTERQSFEKTLYLYELSKKIENLVKQEKSTYRAVGRRTIIENIAICYSNEILVSDSFNVYDNFKMLSTIFKIYKKEAEVLNLLLIKNLLLIYTKLAKDVLKIKRQISVGAKLKILSARDKPAVIYGAYLFNKNSTKLFLKSKADIKSATTTILNELDEIYKKQVVVYNYINFLYKGIEKV